MLLKIIIYIVKKQNERSVFNGNGYSKEWVEEAERRGLPNIRTTVASIQYLTSEKTVHLFEDFGVFTRPELESRAEIKYETYSKIINIEAKAMIDITSKQIIPAVIKYITTLAHSVNEVKGVSEFVDVSVQTELLEMASDLLAKTRDSLHKLIDLTMRAAKMQHGKEQAEFFKDEVVPAMEALRRPVDELEMIVNKDMWPMPSYGDLIFEV